MTGPAKTAVLEAVAELREELGSARRSSRKYTVSGAVAVWIEGGGRADPKRMWNVGKELLARLLAKTGHRPWRELAAMEVGKGLESLSCRYSTWYLQLARNSPERDHVRAVHERVGRNDTGQVNASTAVAHDV